MTQSSAALAAIQRFYRALDALLLGKGTQEMFDAWHHADDVTTIHPYGHWAYGWEQVAATWDEVASVFSKYEGHKQRTDGVGDIVDLRVQALGDVAYSTGRYQARVYFPTGEQVMDVNCTNIVHLRDGEWKIVHHHPDQASPEFQRALIEMVSG